MPKKRVINFIKLALLIILLSTAAVYLVKTKQSSPPNRIILSTSELRNHLNESLRRKDKVSQVYSELKKTLAVSEYRIQYNSLYIYGQEIYTLAGLKGVNSCDDSYGFGCFHGVFSKAIQNGSTNTIKELSNICIKKYGKESSPCQHGIGLAIYQQHKNDINQALSFCEEIQTNPLLGCSSGVFTEYNFPKSAQIFEEYISRPLSANNYYAPCDSVNEKFKPSCYYEINNLWFTTLGPFTNQGKTLCLEIENKEHQKACLKGLGRSTARFSYYEIPKTKNFCHNLNNIEATDHCLSGAVWEFLSRGSPPEKNGLCNEASNREKCIKEGDLRNEKWL